MRWIDIDLADPPRRAAAAPLLARAAALAATVPAVQAREGLDSPAVVRVMAETGQLLWRAILAADPEAFSPTRDSAGGIDPRVGAAETDHGHGYQLTVATADLTLPWAWLHTGLGFLIVRHPLAAGVTGTWPALAQPARPWMVRHRDALLADLSGATAAPARIAGRARDRATRILFLAGHCEPAVRPLLDREAEAIDAALAAAAAAPALAGLWVPERAVAPGVLARGDGWEALHFAGPTARPPAAPVEELWSALAQGGWLEGDDDEAPATLAEVGELELVGVDPISALLDQISARAERRPLPVAEPVAGRACAGRSGEARWLLEDGPVGPEEIGRAGGVPAFVFSNSHLSLPGLGPRFLAAGASTFVGPLAAVRSDPAREFAARFYGCLGDGWGAAAALRGAALACRDRLGDEHPAWLSYGLIGHGGLALQYL